MGQHDRQRRFVRPDQTLESACAQVPVYAQVVAVTDAGQAAVRLAAVVDTDIAKSEGAEARIAPAQVGAALAQRRGNARDQPELLEQRAGELSAQTNTELRALVLEAECQQGATTGAAVARRKCHIDDAGAGAQRARAQPERLAAWPQFAVHLGGEALAEAVAPGCRQQPWAIIIAGAGEIFALPAELIRKIVEPAAQQVARGIVLLDDHLFAPQQVAHHHPHFALAGHGGHAAHRKWAGFEIALVAQGVVDKHVRRRRQRAGAGQHRQREGDEFGLDVKIAGPLDAAEAHGAAPHASAADGVAQPQAGQLRGPGQGDGALQAGEAAVRAHIGVDQLGGGDQAGGERTELELRASRRAPIGVPGAEVIVDKPAW